MILCAGIIFDLPYLYPDPAALCHVYPSPAVLDVCLCTAVVYQALASVSGTPTPSRPSYVLFPNAFFFPNRANSSPPRGAVCGAVPTHVLSSGARDNLSATREAHACKKTARDYNDPSLCHSNASDTSVLPTDGHHQPP